MGHSMGGRVAMQFALEHSEELSNLIVVDVAPKQLSPNSADLQRKYLQAMKAIDVSKVKARRDAEQLLASAIPELSIRQFLLSSLEPTNEARNEYKWKFNLDALDGFLDSIRSFDLSGTSRPFTGPTLFVAGERSDYIRPMEDTPRIKQLFPDASIVSVPNAGHWVQADQPDAFATAVGTWLRSAQT